MGQVHVYLYMHTLKYTFDSTCTYTQVPNVNTLMYLSTFSTQHCSPWPAILMHVTITFCITFCNKTACEIEWLHIKTKPTNCSFKIHRNDNKTFELLT